MQNISQFLKEKQIRELASKVFLFNLEKLKNKPESYILESDLSPLLVTDAEYSEDNLLKSDHLVKELEKVAVLKLNGGLGTSMGLEGPKSQLVVKDGLNFLEITCKQIEHLRSKYGVQVPLIFMNSFTTNEITEANLNKLGFKNSNLPRSFLENKSPKLKKVINQNNNADFIPAKYEQNPELEWAPPGHADIYPSLYETGLLDELISKGYEYLFISNVDNLGATLNFFIFEKFLNLKSDFVMEVAARTENDKKGGHLAIKNNRLILREVAQVIKGEEEDFQNIHKYSFFNTNSLWVTSRGLKTKLDDNDGIFDLPIIVNEKNVNPTDPDSEKIIQLETAMGSAVSLFENAKTILVPPKRFLAIKNTNHLLYLLSDLVHMNSNFELSPTSQIKIELNHNFYKNVSDFYKRFIKIPSLKNCKTLKIESDFYFHDFIELKDEVIL